MAKHKADGFGLKFTARRSWMALRSLAGRVIDRVPVAWTKGFRSVGQKRYLEVAYRDSAELAAQQSSTQPFVVAVARAKDYKEYPHRFETFVALFWVKSTGRRLSDNSIETEVLSRLKAA